LAGCHGYWLKIDRAGDPLDLTYTLTSKTFTNFFEAARLGGGGWVVAVSQSLALFKTNFVDALF